MSYMKPYWSGSNVPYEEYLRRRDIAREGAKPVVAAISEQTKAIVGELQTVNRNLEQVNQTLQWGFAETIQQLRFMNETLSELLKAVKNPAQTAAFEQFEIARDAYRRGLYPEALAAITAAIDGNNASPGYKLEWRFHFFLGFLRLGNFENTSLEVVDLAKAEAAFLEAARIARVDDPDEAARALTAAGWAALVASSGSGDALDRAFTHTANARRTWEAIAEEISLGRADTYVQLAKVAAVRGDDLTLVDSFKTAIMLDYSKLSVAVDDGDLAARAATEAAVAAAIERQMSWLKTETQRRLEIAIRVGIDQDIAGEAFAFAQRLTHTPTATEALTYVASGLTAAPTQSYNSFWDQQMLSRMCVNYMVNVNSVTSTRNGFVFQTLKWANVEDIATSGSSVLRGTASPWVQIHVRLHAPPIIGTRARVEYQEIVLGGGGYRRGEFEVELLGRSLNIQSNAHHADLWHAGQRYELRSDNTYSKRLLKLTDVHTKVMSTIY